MAQNTDFEVSKTLFNNVPLKIGYERIFEKEVLDLKRSMQSNKIMGMAPSSNHPDNE